MVSNASGRPDIIIVGGGILGCALAYDLSCQGVSVELLERGSLAREASWASAGIISAPVPAMETRVEMALTAYRRYPSLVAEVEERTGLSTGFNRTGELMAVEAFEVDAFREIQTWQLGNDIATEWLEGVPLREREPALHERFVAGLVTPETASVRLDWFSKALAQGAVLSGARVREFCSVTGILQSGGKATGVQTVDGPVHGGGVIVAAGAWSGALLQSVDITIPTRPLLGQMLSVSNPPVRIRNIIAGGGGYIVPRSDGTFAVGATVDPEAGFDCRVTPSGVRWLIDLVERVVPSLNQGTLEATWAGLRPDSGDGELVVGKVPHLDNVWVAAGHNRSGALLGPATSQWLAAEIVDGVPSEHLTSFSPNRFL